MRKSFLEMTINSLPKPIDRLQSADEKQSKFIKASDVKALGEFYFIQLFLMLIAKFQFALPLKNRKSIPAENRKLNSLAESFNELHGQTYEKWQMTSVIVEARAKTLDEIVELPSPPTKWVSVDVFMRSIEIVAEYNFYYEFNKAIPGHFANAENEMATLAKGWAARGSWNSRVDHDDQKDKGSREINFDFLNEYRPAENDSAGSDESIRPDTDVPSSENPSESTDQEQKDREQKELDDLPF